MSARNVKALTLVEFRNQAETAGSAIAHDMNDAVLNSADQAGACRAIMAALNQCFNPGNDPIVDAAAGGFAGIIVNVLEVGMANLPRMTFEEMEADHAAA